MRPGVFSIFSTGRVKRPRTQRSATFLSKVVAQMLGEVRKRFAGFSPRAAVEVAIIGLTFIVFNQYWKVDEHVILALLLLLTFARLLSSGLGGDLRRVAIRGVYIYFFLGFLLWIVLSASWSPFPHRSLSYALIVLAAGTTGILQGFLAGINVLSRGIFVGVAAIVIHVSAHNISEGSFGFDEPSWGLYTNPSSLSFVIGIGLLSAVFSVSRSRASWFIVIAFWIYAGIWLVNLSILTSFFALLGSFAIGAVLVHIRFAPTSRKRILGFVYASSISLVGVLFWRFRGWLLQPLGEDENLAERVPLWSAYFEAVMWRPWIGTGWGSTVGWDFPLVETRLSPVYEWFPAHSGYIDIALMLGFVGLFLFLGGLVSLFLESANIASSPWFSVQTAFTPILIAYLSLNDIMATSFPKLVGVFLVGVMVGVSLRIRAGFPKEVAARTPTGRVIRGTGQRPI